MALCHCWKLILLSIGDAAAEELRAFGGLEFGVPALVSDETNSTSLPPSNVLLLHMGMRESVRHRTCLFRVIDLEAHEQR